MQFLVTELTQEADPITILFPMNPESVQVTHAARTHSFSVLELGTMMFPRGDEPYQVSWSGILPGATRRGSPYLNGEWQDPYALITQLHLWQALGAKLNIQVTDAPVNMTGFISTLNHTIQGGYGDVHYDITFIQLRQLLIGVDPATNAAADSIGSLGASGGTSLVQSGNLTDELAEGEIEYPEDVPEYTPPSTPPPGDTRPEANRPGSYLVQPGDSLITIALRYYGDDKAWRLIWEANRIPNGPMNENYNLIQVGWTLVLP